MLSEKDEIAIKLLAEKYGVSKLILFGSSLEARDEINDIDLAVEGISERHFFKFYSELIFNLSKPVDLVDISRKSEFNDFIRKEGVSLYG